MEVRKLRGVNLKLSLLFVGLKQTSVFDRRKKYKNEIFLINN